MNIFKLSHTFLEQFIHYNPFYGNPLGAFTFNRTYSRIKNTSTGELENYHDTIERVVNGTMGMYIDHLSLLYGFDKLDHKELKYIGERMYELILKMKFTPPGRGLWSMGTKLIDLKIYEALNNCGFASTKNIKETKSKSFKFFMNSLMLGVGMGSDVRGTGTIKVYSIHDSGIIEKRRVEFTKRKILEKYIKDVTTIRNNTEEEFTKLVANYTLDKLKTIKFFTVQTVDDTRESWVDSTGDLIDSYFNEHNDYIIFDYSKIRPKGSPIKTFGGVCPGKDPLMILHMSIRYILDKNASINGTPITTNTIVDIFNIIGRSCVSNGVKRSAEIMLGPPTDEFIDLKNYNKNPYRMPFGWLSNNSIIVDKNTKMDYNRLTDNIVDNGEPGIFWIDNARNYSRMIDPPDYKDINADGTNPCSEQTLEDHEYCNLVEIHLNKHINPEKKLNVNTVMNSIIETAEYAFLYGKIVTLGLPNDSISKIVVAKNRRIGLSVTGAMQFVEIYGEDNLCKLLDIMYKRIQRFDEGISIKLQIPKSIKTTSVKPSGCLTKDTLITLLIDHKATDLTLEQIFEKYSGKAIDNQWITLNQNVYVIQDFDYFIVNKITKLYKNSYNGELIKITFNDNTTITGTPNHKLFVHTLRKFVRLDKLNIENIISGYPNKTIINIQHVPNEPTYDLEIENAHYYLANGVFSHNTVSILSDATPGIHNAFTSRDNYMVRRVRVSNQSEHILEMADRYGLHIESCVHNKDSLSVISFPMKGNCNITNDNTTIHDKIRILRMFQKYWSDNQVSNTISFKEDEIKDIPKILKESEKDLKSISLLKINTESYAQLPNEVISEQEYSRLMSKMKNMDNISKQKVYNKSIESETDNGCGTIACELKSLQ